jgi:NitT/TauT family transport system permease protein
MIKFLRSNFFFYSLLFIIIEGLTAQDYISNTLLPRPTQILQLFISQHEMLLEVFLKTASVSFFSYLLASFFAFLLGLFMHQYPQIKNNLMPITLFFQTVPIIAISPLLVIYLGFGLPTIFSAAMIVCFFPVFAATLVGLEQVSQSQVELFRFLKASTCQKLFYLEVPSALPVILSGLKTAAGLSVVGVVSGEFMAGGGLGGLIDSARLQQRVDLVFAALICLSLIGLSLMRITEATFKLLFKAYLTRI